MSQVTNILEVLWAFERMNSSSILSPDEKQIIQKELLHSLPLEVHSNQAMATRNIIASHLALCQSMALRQSPSIPTDEEPIDTSIPRFTTIPKGNKKK